MKRSSSLRHCCYVVLALMTVTSTPSSLAFSPSSDIRRAARTVTALFLKNSGRANTEQMLEDAMGNDWRFFRAQLIARERAEAARGGGNSNSSIRSSHQSHQQQRHFERDSASAVQPLPTQTSSRTTLVPNRQSAGPRQGSHYIQCDQDRLERHGQLGELFGQAISGIFQKNRNARNIKNNKGPRDLYKGDSVGLPNEELLLQDPFVSAAELPIHIKPKKYGMDLHRWAHTIDHIEPGCVLIANEKLSGVFHQTIVLIVDHQSSGTTGIVINRPLEGQLAEIEKQKPSNLDVSHRLAFAESPATFGGPVLPDDWVVLHGYGHVDGSKKVAPGVFVGGSEELMNEVRGDRLDPSKVLFVKGHAAWVPGQLDREIEKGVWYLASTSSDFLLRYAGGKTTPADNTSDLWSDILSCLGGKFAEVARRHGSRGDRRMMP